MAFILGSSLTVADGKKKTLLMIRSNFMLVVTSVCFLGN